jgi:hypothetical protein
MTKQNALLEIKKFERKLPYGAKAEIARKAKVDKHQVQSVFRGLAGETLTLKVYKKAKKLFPEETTIKSRASKKVAA